MNPLFKSLSPRVQHCLENAEIVTIDQLQQWFDSRNLLRIRNLGWRSYAEVGIFLGSDKSILMEEIQKVKQQIAYHQERIEHFKSKLQDLEIK